MSDGSGKGAVLVTGASTGIGRATALHLATHGFSVFAGVRRQEDADSLRQEDATLEPLLIDVTSAEAVSAAAEAVAAAGRPLAGLVNNAGVVIPGPVELLSTDEFRRQLEVNLIGQIAVTQAFLPQLRDAKGRIVFLSSIGGRISFPFMAPYHTSKFAIEALGDALRVELRPWDIKVSLVEPGSIATEIWDKSAKDSDELLDRISPEGKRLYGDRLAHYKGVVGGTGDRGVPPQRVASVIEHALTARRPKTRYLVGIDAKVQARVRRLLPDRLWDVVVSRATGI